MNRCVTCLLPDTYPRLRFDSQGSCNMCRHRPATLPQVRGLEALRKVVDKARRPHGYDCLVALSGGRDSSYTLDFAVHDLQLRVLAVTYDNGYMPEQTRRNILGSVQKLGVDHEFCRDAPVMDSVASFLMAFARKPDPALVAFLCNGCMSGMMKGLYGTARRHGVHLILSGGGEPETSFAEPLLQVRPERFGHRGSLVVGAGLRLAANPRYLLHPRTLLSFLREGYARYMLKGGEIQYVSLFHYVPWDEGAIEERIHSRLGWRKPEGFTTNWRSDCQIHLIKQYFYRELLGFTKNDEILSNMIRERRLDRSEALERLERENDLPEEIINGFLERHGVDVPRLKQQLTRRRVVN
jgi:hypothetical protein